MGKHRIANLIAKSRSRAEAAAFRIFDPSTEQQSEIARLGRQVLQRPPVALECVAISATWANRVRRTTDIPVYVVAGELHYASGGFIFGTGAKPKKAAKEFAKLCATQGTTKWDGHCWIVCGDLIGEASLGRTARRIRAGHPFERLMAQRGGAPCGLFPDAVAEARGIQYVPLHVLTDDQVATFADGCH